MGEGRRATRESHSDHPNGLNSKKRKSPDLRDTPNGRFEFATPPLTSQRSKKKRRTTATSDGDSLPFAIEFPARPARSPTSDETEDIFRARDGPLDSLQIDYTIRPGTKWKGLKQYSTINFSDTNFKRGQIIYVNRTPNPPPPPPEGAPDEDVLAYDKKNLWIGKIVQARAPNVEMAKEVLVFVFWLYWPEELPGGRQPYHGASELVMSNHPEIIDATTISRAAEIVHWDEYDDDNNGNDSDRFWRQTIDFSDKKRALLSVLRKHCICQKEYNPDTTMYKCPHKDCGTWNHEACLGADVLRRAYEANEKGTLEMEMEQKAIENPRTLGGMMTASVEAVKHGLDVARNSVSQSIENLLTEGDLGRLENFQARPPKQKYLQNLYTGKGKPWYGKFRATVSSADPTTGSGAAIAVLRQLGADGASGSVKKKKRLDANGGSKPEEREWTIQLDCLKCGNPLD